MNVKGPREGSFSVVTDSINGCENYSACGNEMQLNVNSQLQVQSTTAGNTGNVVIGGEAAGMDIALSWVYC